MDNRSLRINFEMNALINDKTLRKSRNHAAGGF